LNREWETDKVNRFKKRRELVWVSGNDLLEFYKHAPDKLWKRVRQLENAKKTIHSIVQNKASR
jgi:phosphatidylserine/phosphatidylglycerophosphate/cardiolipin synthase-like enzyme